MSMRSPTYPTMTASDLFQFIRGEYAPRNDIFDRDSERVAKVKRIIAALSPQDQTVILLYCEDRSLQKVADRFNVSKAYIHKTIKRIRKQIISKL